MAGPTYVGAYSATPASDSAATTTLSASITAGAGDVLVLSVVSGQGHVAPQSVSGGGLTWTKHAGNPSDVAADAEATIFTATSPTAQTFTATVTVADSSSGHHAWTWQCQQWSNAQLTGNFWTAAASTSGQLSVTTSAANVALAMVIADYNAISGASRTYVTASAGAFSETYYGALGSSTVTAYCGYYANAGAAGSKTVGLSAPTGTQSAIVVAELTGITVETHSGSAALSGSGTLAASGTPKPKGSAAFTGSGTLSTGAGAVSAAGTFTATATGTLTATGSPHFFGTPVITLTTEAFAGSSGAAWPTQWFTDTRQGGLVTLTGDGRGQLTTSATGNYWADNYAYLTGVTPALDMDVALDVSFPATTECYLNVYLRSDTPYVESDPANAYGLRISPARADGSTITVFKAVNKTETSLATVGPAITANTALRIRFQVLGNTLNVKWWTPGATEPGAWNYTTTDADLAGLPGSLALQLNNGAAATAQTAYVANLTLLGTASAIGTLAVETTFGPRSTKIGVSIGAGDFYYSDTAWVDARLDEIATLGAKWLRTDLNWSWIESTQGVFDWSRADYLVEGANARGLTVLFIIGTIPPWARPDGTPETYGITDAAARSGYSDFCQTAVNRYMPQGITHYELWNEPNHPPFWSTPDAAAYTAMVQSAYTAIKTAQPAAQVILGGTAWTSDQNGYGGILTEDWYPALYAAGIKGYFDAAAMHMYQDPTMVAQGNYVSGQLDWPLRSVRSTMNSNGDTAVPIWNTEMGLPTGGSSSVTEAQQRDGLAGGRKAYFNAETNGVLFLYTMRDRQDTGASTDREDYFGLTSTVGLKPSYLEMQSWIAAAPTGLLAAVQFRSTGTLLASVNNVNKLWSGAAIPSALYVGAEAASAVYLGSTKVWP